MSKPSPLTDEQADAVADVIAQTSLNVYREAEKILGRKLDIEENDAVYKHVEKVGQIFKCAECNCWRADSEGTTTRDDLCAECEDAENED